MPRGSKGAVPSDRTGDDGRLAVFAVVVRRLLWSSAGVMCLCLGFPVVVGSLGKVVEHGVGGEDLSQRRVGHGSL